MNWDFACSLRRVRNTLVVPVLAASLVLSGLSVRPAAADTKEVLKVLAGAAAVALVVNELKKKKERDEDRARAAAVARAKSDQKIKLSKVKRRRDDRQATHPRAAAAQPPAYTGSCMRRRWTNGGWVNYRDARCIENRTVVRTVPSTPPAHVPHSTTRSTAPARDATRARSTPSAPAHVHQTARAQSPVGAADPHPADHASSPPAQRQAAPLPPREVPPSECLRQRWRDGGWEDYYSQSCLDRRGYAG